MNSQICFYKSKKNTKRTDDEFYWSWYSSVQPKSNLAQIKTAVRTFVNYTPWYKWFIQNSELLFATREILEDEYSKLQFDLYIILKIIGHNKLFFPRYHFDDFITIFNVEEFDSDLPKDYGGFPLKKYTIKIDDSSQINQEIIVVTYEAFITLTNKWRQYFIKRDNINLIPAKGDIVFDCGSCIGDTAILFASFVGDQGEVHLFDPVPLHNRYSRIQADLNPFLKKTFHINEQAVGDMEKKLDGIPEDVSRISPGGCVLNNFEVTTIDNYFSKHDVQKVDLIKMDIEGAEIAALIGSSATITNFKPKLALAAYHKEDDLWKIPLLMKKLNPGYKIYFEHHLPIYWEACFYAI